MKKPTIIAALLIICFAFVITTKAQDSTISRIAILPFHANGIDQVYIETSESLLMVEINKLSAMDIVSAKRTKDALADEDCNEADCATEVGKKLNADEVFGCSLSSLGEKIIVQYFLVNVSSGKDVLVDQISTTNVEELETVMKRIAKSVVDIKPAGQSAEVGNILQGETKESLRRTSKKNVGISFGYLYPQSGYDNNDRIFVADLHLDYELDDYAVGMLLGIRKGFAINIYGDYLFTRTDFCPFIGGAFGFHWVSHGSFYDPYSGISKDKRGDGFEITANTGMRILHTYNFQILINLEFIYTMNEYDDKAIVFSIGIL